MANHLGSQCKGQRHENIRVSTLDYIHNVCGKSQMLEGRHKLYQIINLFNNYYC